MRFDARCRECAFFKMNVPPAVDCANNDGTVWDPREKACDNFIKTRVIRVSSS